MSHNSTAAAQEAAPEHGHRLLHAPPLPGVLAGLDGIRCAEESQARSEGELSGLQQSCDRLL